MYLGMYLVQCQRCEPLSRLLSTVEVRFTVEGCRAAVERVESVEGVEARILDTYRSWSQEKCVEMCGEGVEVCVEQELYVSKTRYCVATVGGFQLQLLHETKIRSFRRLTRSALAQTARIPSLHMTDTTPAH